VLIKNAEELVNFSQGEENFIEEVGGRYVTVMPHRVA